MRSLFLSIFILSLGLTTLQAQSLQEHRWNHRVLLVFSPQDQPEKAQEQIAAMEVGTPAWNERKLVVYDIAGEGGLSPDGYISVEDSRKLRKVYGVSLGEFLVILVGLDGKEKLRRFEPVTQSEIFGLIDSMPMRKVEMEGQKAHDP